MQNTIDFSNEMYTKLILTHFSSLFKNIKRKFFKRHFMVYIRGGQTFFRAKLKKNSVLRAAKKILPYFFLHKDD